MWLQGPSLEKSSEEIPPILLSHRLLPHDLVIEQLKKKKFISHLLINDKIASKRKIGGRRGSERCVQ